MIQYNAALAITDANQIYRGLGLEFLADWRWFQKIFLSQIFSGLLPVCYMYIATVVKEFTKQDQQIKRIYSSLQ